jgi:hypothetical protein
MGLTWIPYAFATAKEEAPKGAQELLSIGKPGAHAIDLTIRTDQPERQPLKAGDSIVLHVKAVREAYVTAIYVSSGGDAVVLFPNSKTPDNRVLPEKEYTLFGEGSGITLKVSDKMKEGQIVFFASSTPFSLAPLKTHEGQACIHIAGSAAKDLGVLKRKIQTLAQDKGFSRTVLQLRAKGGEGVSLNLMGLPTSVTSDKPEGITGVQGAKPQDIKQ